MATETAKIDDGKAEGHLPIKLNASQVHVERNKKRGKAYVTLTATQTPAQLLACPEAWAVIQGVPDKLLRLYDEVEIEHVGGIWRDCIVEGVEGGRVWLSEPSPKMVTARARYSWEDANYIIVPEGTAYVIKRKRDGQRAFGNRDYNSVRHAELFILDEYARSKRVAA